MASLLRARKNTYASNAGAHYDGTGFSDDIGSILFQFVGYDYKDDPHFLALPAGENGIEPDL